MVGTASQRHLYPGVLGKPHTLTTPRRKGRQIADCPAMPEITEHEIDTLLRDGHHGIERNCWKQHPDNFKECQEPACQLLRSLAALAGWRTTSNGVIAPDDPRFNDPAWV